MDMKSQIFECVENNDVEGLKLLTNYPNFFQIEDDNGYTILQKAISGNKIAVFDFLLSLDGCPINAPNSGGRTAFQVAHHFYSEERGEHFVYSLLKKGAEIDCCGRKTWLLYDAIVFNHIKVAKYLIEKGADLNCYYKDDETLLHEILQLEEDRDELLTMLLYFGADLSIPDEEGHKPIDFVCEDGYLTESMREQLVLYFFDDYCTDYEIPLDSLFDLLRSRSPVAPQVIKYINSVKVDDEGLESFFMKLFTIKPAYLKLLLEKFDYVVEAILDDALEANFLTLDFTKKICFQNLTLLLQSQFSSDVIEVINDKFQIFTMFKEGSTYRTIPRDELFNLTLFMLSYGANIYDYDLEHIYPIYGYCEFFRTLLYMDIKIIKLRHRFYPDIIPGLFYNINIEFETLLEHHTYTKDSLYELLHYFAHAKLRLYCLSRPFATSKILAKARNLPSVPLLVELARSKVRKFLIQRYKIKNSMQFHTLIKRLPISKVHEKIITYETKLY